MVLLFNDHLKVDYDSSSICIKISIPYVVKHSKHCNSIEFGNGEFNKSWMIRQGQFCTYRTFLNSHEIFNCLNINFCPAVLKRLSTINYC